MHNEILETILGTENITDEMIIDQIKNNSVDLLSELETYKIFGEEATDTSNKIQNILKKLSKIIINKYSKIYFDMPIEIAIATQEQEKIKSVFLNVAEELGFDQGLQNQINSDLEEISNKLNKRFTFDEASLIHLIEASKGSNIQLEEGIKRYSNKGKRQILKQKEDGTYYLSESKETDMYTSGKKIPTQQIKINEERTLTKTTVDEQKNILLSAYPTGSELIGTKSTGEILKEVMTALFENLELCIETYKFFYTGNKTINNNTIKNNVVLADNSEFEFYYMINKENLPHLLGIQKGIILSKSTINFFSEIDKSGRVYYPINEHSSALDILKAIIKNKTRIIENRGLIEENGKLYQLLPWEKIILKTSSFMRGDFFKTCFCLVELDHGINSKNEKYASISSTKYNEDMTNNKFDARRILKDLINTSKQSKDFIFRTFINNIDRNGNIKGYIPQSIDTGKAENIIISGLNQRLKTLDRFRYALQNNSGSMIAQSIENEKMGKRNFSPIEQALTHINISTQLNINPQLSKEAYMIREMLEEELQKDVKTLTNSRKK